MSRLIVLLGQNGFESYSHLFHFAQNSTAKVIFFWYLSYYILSRWISLSCSLRYNHLTIKYKLTLCYLSSHCFCHFVIVIQTVYNLLFISYFVDMHTTDRFYKRTVNLLMLIFFIFCHKA